jgi:membrane-associated phospholipid phosphatase
VTQQTRPLAKVGLKAAVTRKGTVRRSPSRTPGRDASLTDQNHDRRTAAMLDSVRAWLEDARSVDWAVYSAIALTPTPSLDRQLSTLSHAANYSRLWIASAAVLALLGGRQGRRAALEGLASIAATSAVVNLAVKAVGRRKRPDRARAGVPQARHVAMPMSRSFPSGHSAAAFAFATGVGHRMPVAAVPLHAAAGVVAYSRVHTGVHHPSDVVVGSVVGTALAQLTTRTLNHYCKDRGTQA